MDDDKIEKIRKICARRCSQCGLRNVDHIYVHWCPDRDEEKQHVQEQ
jgi:hypothetical protein